MQDWSTADQLQMRFIERSDPEVSRDRDPQPAVLYGLLAKLTQVDA